MGPQIVLITLMMLIRLWGLEWVRNKGTNAILGK